MTVITVCVIASLFEVIVIVHTAVVHVIGFLNTSYTVGESDGVANIQIGVIQGSLYNISVVVQFSIYAISAAGKI